MASGDVQFEPEKQDSESFITNNAEKPNMIDSENVKTNGDQPPTESSGDSILILPDKMSLQWNNVMSENCSSEKPNVEKVHVNGMKSDTTEVSETNTNNRPIQVNAKGWSLSTEGSVTLDKRLNPLAYSYTAKCAMYPNNLQKGYTNQQASPSKHYNTVESGHDMNSAGSSIGSGCQSAGNREHVVLLHVNPGETISFYMGDHTQHIQGPATVPMVSCNSTPPMPMPVQVPPGHMVQQLVDEHGTLCHIILSPQPPVAVPVGSPYNTGSSSGAAPTVPGGGPSPPFFLYPHPTYAPPPMQFHPHMQPGLANQGLHNHAGHLPPQHGNANQGPSSPGQYSTVNANVHKDERTQKQYFKLKKRFEARQKDCSVAHSETSPSIRNDGTRKNNCSKVEGEPEKQTVESDQSKAIYEFLSSIAKPNISQIAARSALVTWVAPILASESGDEKHSDIKTEDILYHVLISDKSQDNSKRVIYSGKLLEYKLTDLKPGTSYFVCIQAGLDQITGKSSDCTTFKSLASKPDAPQYPKLVSRTKTSIILKWNAAVDNGSKVINYLLEYDEGKGGDNFVEVFCGLQKQFKVMKLTASTCYRFRMTAINEFGKSDCSEIACFSTSGSPPSQPSPPDLAEATSCSLSLTWESRPNDDSYTLQMEDKTTMHGFLPVYNGKEITHTCFGLKRSSVYKFRLCANNDEGSSVWSLPVSFSTLPEKPTCPTRLGPKGRVHSNNFKVSWELPRDPGGSEIEKYDLEMDSGNGFENIYSGDGLEYHAKELKPGTNYIFRVQCTSAGGISSYSEPCTIETVPVVPGKCPTPRLVGKPKAISLHLKWTFPDYNGGTEVLGFEVEILNPDATTREVFKGEATDCIVAGLQPGRVYSFHVRALNKVGPGLWSDMLEVTSGAGNPDVPSDVTAVARSAHSIYVSWTEPPDNGAPITEYRLESSSNETFTTAYVGANLNAEVKNLMPASSYFFRVQAVNSAGVSPFNELIKCETPPSSPAAVAVANIKMVCGATTVSLSWKEPHDNGSSIVSYNVEVGDNISVTADQPEVCIEGLVPETTYKVRMQAVNAIGVGPFSSLKVTTRGLPPSPPIIEAYGYSHNSLRLKWGDGKNPEFIQYTLEVQNIYSGSWTPVYQGTGHCHKVSRLDEMTKYSFRIYASNTEGDGPHSKVYEFSTLKAVPAPPKAPKISSVTESSCVVEWQPAKCIGDDMVSYKLQIGSKTSDYKVAYTGIQTNFTLRNLQSNTEYSVRIAAVRHCTDGSGELCSPFSPNSVFCTNNSLAASKLQAPKSSMIPSLKDREPLTDQQWAIIILLTFTFLAISVAILIQWILSYTNS